ncbi:hypothetical protein [Saudi moumouvirus]|nr:hypothetical protein [Saudi moumouvirus]
MSQQLEPIKFGDIVFICFPSTDKGPKIVNDVGHSHHGHNRIIANTGTIINGDPYQIVQAPNIYPNSMTGQPIRNSDIIRLTRLNDSQLGQWYNADGDQWIEIRSNTKANDIRPNWRINAIGAQPNTIINYGQQFRLRNLRQPYDATFRTNGNSSYANVSVSFADNTYNSVLMFLPGPLDNAKLQCCKDNPIFTQPDYCGQFRGTTCSGQCDDILTNYCAQVTASDPKCGCLLPANFYQDTIKIGPPECIDDRCVDTNSYRKSTQCHPNCNIINCDIDINNFNGQDVNKIIYNQICGNSNGNNSNNGNNSGGTTSRSRLFWFIIIGVIIIIIFIALVILLAKNL